MNLIGFGFNKINAEKFSSIKKGLTLNNNINIFDVSFPKEGFFKSKKDIVEIKFNYILNYSPEIAKIELGGSFIFEVESQLAKDIENKWKEKTLPEDFRTIVLNFIVKKSNVRALQIEEEFNLPYHIPFPTLKKSEKKE